MNAPFNIRQLNLWALVQQRFEAIGLGFLPLGAMKAIFISVAILILLPLAAIALAAAALVITFFVILWLALFLIKLPFRLLGLLLGTPNQAAPQEDDGRRNVRVIQRPDNSV